MNPADISILVVDEEPDNRDSTVQILMAAGYHVTRAATGDEALRDVQTHQPNLLLLDRDLPGVDGLEVCRRIKADPATMDCLVILVSRAHIASESQADGLEAGADGYIVRPITHRELLARVGAYIRLIQLQHELRQKTAELTRSVERQRAEAERQQQSQLRAALLELPTDAETLDEKAFVQRGQALAEDLTGSAISFIHFVPADQETNPLKPTGLWADAWRERRPVTFNACAAPAPANGRPADRPTLSRLITVPVIEHGRVVMLAGVANKSTDYTEHDVKAVQLIGESIWRIVQSRRTHAQLRRNEQRLTVAIDTAKIAVFEMDRDLRYTWMHSPPLGFTAEQMVGRTDAELMGEDGAHLMARKRRSLETGRGLREEMRIRLAGAERYFELIVEPVRAEDGSVTGLRGAISDITARRQAEEKLRQLSRIVEQAPLSVAITDLTGAIEYANPTFCTLSGYTLAEVLGQNPRVLKSGRTAPEVYLEMWDTLTRGEVWRGELTNKRKDGALYDELAVIAPVTDDAGKITHYVALKQDITDRKKAEAALRDSEERFRELFDLESDAIVVVDSKSGLIVQANLAATTTYGYSMDELLTLRIVDFSAEREKTLEVVAAARRDLEGAIKVPRRLHRKRDGTVFPVEVSIRPFRRGDQMLHVAVIRDITDQVRAREQLERFNAELEEKVALRTDEIAARNRQIEALLHAIPDMVLRLRTDGTVLYAQPARGPVVLVTAAGPGVAAQVGPELIVPCLQLGQRALADDATVTTETALVVDEIEVTVELRAAPSGSEEFVVFARDITARKRLEAEASAMLEKERQVSEMKTRFISVTSHEFRTPMAAAMGSVELLHNHFDLMTPAKREELFVRINSSMHRMTRMLDEILTLSRIDAGRITKELGAIDLRHYVQSLVDEVRLGDRDEHRFTFTFKGDGANFPSDTNLLHHILSNVLSNAARYSPPGTLIATHLSANAAEAVLSVEDQGIGVPEGDRLRIFEPFERGSNVGNIKGTGLGLNIVKRMTLMLGGSVGFESVATGGSRFVLHLPRHTLPVP